MWPWPDMAQLGIQKLRGLLAAESNNVPDCASTGVPVRLVIWYHRDPSRPPELLATPLLLTWMLCAAHKLPLCMRVPNNRSSRSSKCVVLPSAGTPPSGLVVAGTVMLMFAEMDGVPPGLDTRRNTRVPKEVASTPIK